MWFEGTALAQSSAGAAGPQGMMDQLLTNPVVPIALIFVVM
jgi:hypothetical protein